MLLYKILEQHAAEVSWTNFNAKLEEKIKAFPIITTKINK